MTQSKFIASEQKSGYGPEELEGLRGKIGEWIKKIDELNGDTLEVKAEMALKNKFITLEQERELLGLINQDDLHNRYMNGEVTEDLLEQLKGFYEKVKNKRDEIFPDAPKNAKLKLAEKEGEDADNKNKNAPGKRQPLKIMSEGEFEKKEPEKETGIDEDLIGRRSAEIKQRRISNEPGFEWKKIDDLLHNQGFEPGTPAAAEYLEKWDRNTAESELRREIRKGEKEGGQPSPRLRLASQPADLARQGADSVAPEKGVDRIKKERMEEIELARLGAEITLSKITDYKELWAENEQAGDEVFKQKTRELWKEFAVHGKILKDKETGRMKLMKFTDFDGNSSLGLLNLAGIDTKNLEYREPGKHTAGKINIDTGERHGIVLEDGGKTVFIDHHSDESGKDSSATKFTYDLLVSLGLLEKQKYLDKLVEFVTQADNKNFPGAGKYFKNYGRNLLGLRDHIKFKHLLEFFEAGHEPYEVLQEKELKKMGLFAASKQKEATVYKALMGLERIKENGLVVESPRYGKIAVDIDKKLPLGPDAISHAGYQTYLSWSSASNSFFISSASPITDSFAQGKKIRGTMWLKPAIDETPLTVTLKEILTIMTDGQFQPTGELAEFLAKEEQKISAEKETKLSPEIQEILVSAVNEFRQQLQIEAEAMEGWNNYKEEEKKTLLDIETKSFLRQLVNERLVARSLVVKEDADKFVESLI